MGSSPTRTDGQTTPRQRNHVTVRLGEEEKKVISKVGSFKGSGGEGKRMSVGNRKVRLLAVCCFSWAERLGSDVLLRTARRLGKECWSARSLKIRRGEACPRRL